MSLVLAAGCLVSLVSAALFPFKVNEVQSPIHFVKDTLKLWYLFWPIILMMGLRPLPFKNRLFILQAWIITFGVLSIIGFFQHYTGWPRPQLIPGEEGTFHTTLFFRSPPERGKYSHFSLLFLIRASDLVEGGSKKI